MVIHWWYVCFLLPSVHFDGQSVIDSNGFFKPLSTYATIAWQFPIWYRCIFVLAHSWIFFVLFYNSMRIFHTRFSLPSRLFVAASHQTRLDTMSKARRPIKVGIKGGRSGTSRDSHPAGQCCSSTHLVQCEPDEASSFTNPNVGPGTYASLRLKLDAQSSAIHG